MKVAALYDVHGMPWALEAVLEEARDADTIVFGGDLIAIAELEASGWPPPREFVAENVRVAITREEAAEHFESGA